ncbi:MAG: NAD(P)(+) transhydrogenase (Re/Si-specific) subunit beta [Bacteroidales bacterium]|nr:NAD(P)(+) transhydrogenase (Re/Si-specific) subunit beta [Bacteroidales bacterium]
MAVLLGIHLMSKVEKAHIGNKISALAIALGIIITLIKKDILPVWLIYPGMAAGLITGLILAKRVKMIEMPQLVALLNGIGGAASAIVASFAFLVLYRGNELFGKTTASLAIVIGMITLSGSLVAAGKLHKILTQKPVILPLHQAAAVSLLIIILALVSLGGFFNFVQPSLLLLGMIVLSAVFGIIFSVRVGGADMPVTISLLNSLSGVAAAIAGFAVTDILLVSVGGIVGASGLFLTQIMCRAMNRKLLDILLGKTALKDQKSEKKEKDEKNRKVKQEKAEQESSARQQEPEEKLAAGKEKAEKDRTAETEITEEDTTTKETEPDDPMTIIRNAKHIIIVPGYGMALAHAQHLVKKLAGTLVKKSAVVKYAIHPVAGRMPGHMDVLLIEAGVAFEDVYEMDDINDEFKEADLTIVVGANDVMNPAARNAEGTPIYGMPILNVDQCKNILIFNYDLKPGYSGVDNPIYDRKDGVWIIQGDASVTLAEILNKLQ